MLILKGILRKIGVYLVGALIAFLVFALALRGAGESGAQRERLQTAQEAAERAETGRKDRLKVEVSQEAERRAAARSVRSATDAARTEERHALEENADCVVRALDDGMFLAAIRAGNAVIESTR